MDNRGTIRRNDLWLRARYPEISTTIFKITAREYQIFCEGFQGDFEHLKKEFHHSIRFIGSPCDITDIRPLNFIEIVPCIPDDEISKDFEGVPMTLIDLLNLLCSKFPRIQFFKTETTGPGKVTIYTASFEERIDNKLVHHFLTEKNRTEVLSFLDGFRSGIKFHLIEEKVGQKPDLTKEQHHNPVQYIYASSFSKKSPPFEQRDEALWYDNIDKIFEGSFKKNDLYFYNEKEYSCYVDYSSFQNIDIRNLLFLFQVIYITLPYNENIAFWLKNSNISKMEFIELVVRDRIKIILTQPMFRQDGSFLMEVYNAKPDSVISRRATAALEQIDLIDISDNYILNGIDLKEAIKFIELVGEATKTNSQFLYEMLIWPIKARRSSFEYLNSKGIFGVPAFGINTVIESRLSPNQKDAGSFELGSNAHVIHLANALNATYFPFTSKEGYSNYTSTSWMGEFLNFYKNATPQKMKSFIESKDRINSGIIPINPIDIIEVNSYLTITELEDELNKAAIFPGSKKLLETLSDLSEEERMKKIDSYNEQIIKKVNKKEISESAIDLGTNIVLDGVSLAANLAGVGTTFSLLKSGSKKISKTTIYKGVLDKIFYSDTDKANIHYLTKINRVAKLKRNL